MNVVRPTYAVQSLGDIDPYEFHELHPDIEGIALDLDKTIVGQHERVVSARQLAPLLVWGGELGLQLAIGSNAGPQRVPRAQEIGAYIGQQAYSQSRTETGVIVVCSADVENRKKPDSAVFDEIASRMKLESDKIAFIGDQLVRDIGGAEAAGYGVTVLVGPYGKGENPGTRLVRAVESVIRPRLGLPRFVKDFPKQLEPQPALV